MWLNFELISNGKEYICRNINQVLEIYYTSYACFAFMLLLITCKYKDILHKSSKRIVEFALTHNAGIKLELLTGIRQRAKIH